MKKQFLALLVLVLLVLVGIVVQPLRAQSRAQTVVKAIECGVAVARLQNYATQVNRAYNDEYGRLIPYVRCPAYDVLGRPFHPVLVQNCRVQMLGFLNNWYGQQAAFVNNWYAQIVDGCVPKKTEEVARRTETETSEREKIDTKKIDDLTGGVDEEKAIRITIPKTADGFKPRQ